MASPLLEIPEGSHFPLTNLPYGVFSRPGVAGDRPRVGVAVGEGVLDVAAVADAARLAQAPVLAAGALNPFMATGPGSWAGLRARLTDWLTGEGPLLEGHLHPRSEVRLHLPFEVADYVDFYSSEHHARNVGALFRPGARGAPDQPGGTDLLPANWRHLPMGYHGRAGTVALSGSPVVRPSGIRRETPDGPPLFGPTRRLDFEAEVGFVVGRPSEHGRPVPLEAFPEHVFGLCLVNDWSARDIQAFEYVPLGPFLAKAFHTSLSPWVVPLAALAAARTAPPHRDPPPAGHLDDAASPSAFDLTLEVRINGHTVSRPGFAAMYWTGAQQLAHLTSSGASLRTGDLYASGTVSGPEPGQWGCLLELTEGGAVPLVLGDGSRRAFLEDGDEVVITATAPACDGGRLGFGEVAGRVAAALAG